MKLPRFRLRTLLIFVMLAGIGIGGYVLWQRAEHYRAHAAVDEQAERDFAGIAKDARLEWLRVKAAGFRDHYAALKWKHLRAARYPFLPTTPDPPDPTPWDVIPPDPARPE